MSSIFHYEFLAVRLRAALLLVGMALFVTAHAQHEEVPNPSHPRLLLLKGEERRLLADLGRDSLLFQVHRDLLHRADNLLQAAPLTRQMTGRRLLSVSREALRRIFLLSYAYRTTRDARYGRRAKTEMLAIANFSDWNPPHFLDVSEMTMGLAIGYDWLYSLLSHSERTLLCQTIVEKGLRPSYNKAYNWFDTAENNWNQVCHAGMLYGALAVRDRYKPLADSIIDRALRNVRIPMQGYAPDGAYPEGTGYWGYGTNFNVMLLSAVERLCGKDFGLSESKGFMQTGEYLQAMTLPSLQMYCYSDNGQRAGVEPAVFWFYGRSHDAQLLYSQLRIIRETGLEALTRDRLAPAALLWAAGADLAHPQKPSYLFWKAGGDNPVCTMRSGWERGATFLGVKLGSPYVNHGHMDVGSFVYEREGVVWACDLGTENYTALEQHMNDLWNRKQESGRWNVFRYNNRNHNTLTFNGEKQLVKGKAEVLSWSDRSEHMYVTTDLSELYRGQVESVRRACSLIDQEDAVIEDLISVGDSGVTLTWTLMTPALPTEVAPNVVRLEKEDRALYVRVEGGGTLSWNFEPAIPQNSYEGRNDGIVGVRFSMELPRNSRTHLRVILSSHETPREIPLLLKD
ncbi:MAG: heparinase II/III family protein [Bacteroidaceae bacterium]|nr:heparinase II/III family protein [Bacteroidaceae bacterium]